MKPGKTGIARIIDASIYSMRGFRFAWKHEAAFRQELCLSIIMTPLALYLGDSAVERTILLIPVFLVLVVELLNSAVEAAIDRIGAEQHELSGAAKDIGSAAVFASLVLVGLVWGIFLLDAWL